MTFPRPKVDIRAVPAEFDDVIDWLERWSYNLVLLEEYPLSDVRSAIAAVETTVRSHEEEADAWVRPLETAKGETGQRARVILNDHEWFSTSLEQFWWFFRVVEADDHGGHRQALGQYGRVIAEALRRHSRDERWLEAQRDEVTSARLDRSSEKP